MQEDLVQQIKRRKCN